MRYIYLANNRVGHEVVHWLSEHGHPPTALVLHPLQRGKFREEIVAAAGVDRDCIFDGSVLRRPETLNAIKSLELELGLSVFFDYILEEQFLDLFPRGCLNLHPALLPYNRGQYPNVWSIVEGTPAGVTLHYIDKGVDTGDIIAQREVPVAPTDTGEILYRKLEQASYELFCETWDLILRGAAPRHPQRREAGTHHRTKDVEAIDEIQLDRQYLARDLINVLRARTFPPYRGAYFVHENRRIYLRLALQDEAEL